jgi:hypothetical protein
MTVKATLAYGKSFHFYHEALDNNYVYLELEDVPCEVWYRRVMVAIPIDIWEVIRGLGAAKLELINASEEDIFNIVGEAVDKRIAEYERIRSLNREESERLSFGNSIAFGAADTPREQQMVRGIEYYKTEQERQREVVRRMAQHRILEINSEATPAEID